MSVNNTTDVELAKARRRLARQPTPITGRGSVTDHNLNLHLHPVVQSLLVERRDQCSGEYGTELRTHNGRNARHDELQELVDALNYAVQTAIENAADPSEGARRRTTSAIRRAGVYHQAIIDLCEELDEDGL